MGQGIYENLDHLSSCNNNIVVDVCKYQCIKLIQHKGYMVHILIINWCITFIYVIFKWQEAAA